MPTRKIFEYQIEEVNFVDANTLNQFGELGWEVFSITYDPDQRLGDIRNGIAFAVLAMRREMVGYLA